MLGRENEAEREEEADREEDVEDARRIPSEFGDVGGRLKLASCMSVVIGTHLPFCEAGVMGLRGV